MYEILTELKESLYATEMSKWNIKIMCEQFAWSKNNGHDNVTHFCKCPSCDYADYPDFCPDSILYQTACNYKTDCR